MLWTTSRNGGTNKECMYKEVQIINTPGNSTAVGATIIITWTYTPQANALPGILSVVDYTSKNSIIISNSINLNIQSYTWIVNVPAGTYYLILNDGSDIKYSGNFTVFQPAGAAPTSIAPAALTSVIPAAPTSVIPAATASPPNSPDVPHSAPNFPPALPVQPTSSPEKSSSSNVGIYIGVAICGIVVGLIFAFVGNRVYKKHKNSKFVPTPSSANHYMLH
ncbi:16948_t:CDS:2 [Dentiscutata erythropus]|uniref:16948_t:CDS:1 n=1 Tax=Dentiscutata erythropus TaxID=1348616 RepID=A0A9N9CI37_9GLOM|nr:16948_t:CDS:2 [Dentiscutata erythropus]